MLPLDFPFWPSSNIQPLIVVHNSLPQFCPISQSPRHHTHPHHCFHPQSNGLMEHFHRQLKTTLPHLPWFILSFCSSPREFTNLSPAKVVFSTPLVLPAQFPATPDDDSSHLLSQLDHTLSGSLTASLSPSSPPEISHALFSSQFVFFQNPPNSSSLSPAYAGPYKVLKCSPCSFTLPLKLHPLSCLPAAAHQNPLSAPLHPNLLPLPILLIFPFLPPLSSRPQRLSHPPTRYNEFLF